MSHPAPAPRKARLEDALRALLDDADAFGVLGFGAESSPPTVAEAGAAAPAANDRPVPTAAVPQVAPEPRPRAWRTDAALDLAPSATVEDPATALRNLAVEIEACRRCPLGGLRAHAVPGQGNPRAEIFFVGESPGSDEDLQGLAFVGEAGRLLTKMIEATGYARDEVFVADVLKCRPPGGREPDRGEVGVCRDFLYRQIAIVRPKVICALGDHAAGALLETDEPVGRLRGAAHRFHGTPVVATYHPTHLLRSPNEKSKAWDDLKFMLKLLGKEPPPRPTSSVRPPVA